VKVTIRLLLIVLMSVIMVVGCSSKSEKKDKDSYNVSRFDNWITYDVPGVLSFQAPQTMELKTGSYKVLTDAMKERSGITVNSDDMVLQQKGLNDKNPEAFKKYCRILVNTERSAKGTYLGLWDDYIPSEAELSEFESEMMRGLAGAQGISILNTYPPEVVSINGIDMVKFSYRRTGVYKQPVFVTTYLVQNNSMMHNIAVSYRESEMHLWKDDLDKVIYTFKFIEN